MCTGVMERSPSASVNDYDSLDEGWQNKDGERHIRAAVAMKICNIYYKSSTWRPGPTLETDKNILIIPTGGVCSLFTHLDE